MKNCLRYFLSYVLLVAPLLSLPINTKSQTSPQQKNKPLAEKQFEPQLGEEAQQQIEAIIEEKRNLSPAQRKIDTQLRQAAKLRQGQIESVRGVPLVKNAVEVTDTGKTVVEIKAQVSEELLSLLKNIDGEILSTSVETNTIRARLPIDLLEAVAARDDVRLIRTSARFTTNARAEKRLPHQTQPKSPVQTKTLSARVENLRSQLRGALPSLAITRTDNGVANEAVVTGPPTTQGDAGHRANDVRATYGVDGAGISIGVLSDSARYLERSQASGNLPKDVTVLPGQSGLGAFDEGEGTAMMEIIYDIAPGAKLFFATGTSDEEGPEGMARNIRDLRFKYHCDIIVDDIGWSDQLPFQDYTLASAVNDVIADGANYFSSAGNGGNYNDGTSGTWQGDFKDAGRATIGAGDPLYTFHDFGAGVISNRITRLGSDGFAFVRLFWSDPADTAENDYDIYVLDATLRRVKAFSVDDQAITQFPGEFLAGFFSEGDRIIIANYSGAKPRALYLDTFGTAEIALTTPGQIIGQAAAAEAFAVAAVPASTAQNGVFLPGPTTPVESFSSDGPRHVFFNSDGSPITPDRYLFADGGTVRQKPDITAADGVSTSLPQSFFSTFYGTSAAAPHAAAIAALLKSTAPDINREQLREALTSTALDIGPLGWDNASGAGIVSALGAYLKVKPSPFLEYMFTQLVAGVGDGDSFIEPGEEGAIKVVFRNAGNAFATGVKATIASSSPDVTITAATSDYFQISDGKAEVNLSHFKFLLSPKAVCGAILPFTITVSSDQTLPRTFSFSVQTGQPASTPSTLSLRNGNIAIPDGTGSGIALPLPIAGFTAPITKFAFRFDGTDCSSPTGVGLQHDRVSDLVVTLTSPSGTTVTLLSNPGGLGLPSKNFCGTLLDDAAATSIQNITTAGAPYSGAYRPSGRFASFNGQSANGTWVLRITDRVAGTSGILRGFSFLIYTYSCQTSAPALQEIKFDAR